MLMRLADAIDQGRRVLAVIRGWGISSDGHGGITRPEVEGQLLAIQRAYRRAGLGINTVAYFEGHGTGTSVGDATELRALGRALREAGRATTAAGHHRLDQGEYRPHQGRRRRRRADQGRPGLDAQILPPTTGCDQPHPELTGDRPALRVLKKGRALAGGPPVAGGRQRHGLRRDQRSCRPGVARAAIAGASASAPSKTRYSARPRTPSCSCLERGDSADLRRQVDDLLVFAGRLSLAELTDLAAHLAESLEERVHTVRAAIVASRPAELKVRLESATRTMLRTCK